MMEIQDPRLIRERKVLLKLLEMGKERKRRSYNKIIKSLIKEGMTEAKAVFITAKLINEGILRRIGSYFDRAIYEIDVKALERLLETEE
ncbi:hypothetical protein [Candidatus Methanodesulfokora washburnensis]|jgi:DNA-binding Lrp family transcriptional regulator|uniref:Uncharacterized protein n=1 Tax=Candidatus Methanodesulfokora washburnensis TaxID=2478471 RepID=A0A3R9PTV6_9CREN|nr:hypothetical protein [Candidatus Methanodesulfokores washburnensis]RSN72925.1 hypothetical protein D6D85_11905 [Candidatus Methanodesulfokores washburnensis]